MTSGDYVATLFTFLLLISPPQKSNMTAFPAPEKGSTAAQLILNMSNHLKVSTHRLQPFIRLQEDLFLDRFDLDMLVADLENRHSRFLTDEEAKAIETIGDIQRLFLPKAA